jgi:sugar phosphate isomerase/epimerase
MEPLLNSAKPSRWWCSALSSPKFRIGSTSYVIPDHIIPNVEVLGPLVSDVELVLFESEEYGGNYPDGGQIEVLAGLAATHDLTYTVHLPLDLAFGEDQSAQERSMVQAARVIEATGNLRPYAYVFHMDGRRLGGRVDDDVLERWRAAGARAVAELCGLVDEPGRLCVENLEGWNPEAFAPLVEDLAVGRTIDIGHFWLQDQDPLEHLERWIDRARVIHLHGIAERDHMSLAHVPNEKLDPVVKLLLEAFTGVVTLEVFSMNDLTSSLDVLSRSMSRVLGVGR